MKLLFKVFFIITAIIIIFLYEFLIEQKKSKKVEFKSYSADKQTVNEDYKYLKKSINDNMTTSDIVNTFEKICDLLNKDEMILFETGTYSFSDEPLFYFSLVKQVPNNNEEFYQIHVDVLYKPDDENKLYSGAVWNEEIDENIFDFIRKSEAYKYTQNNNFIKIKVYVDET